MKHLSNTPVPIQQRFSPLSPSALYIIVAMIVISLSSATVLSGHFSSAETYSGAFQKLEEKRNTVLALTAASATASAALTLIPDDTYTPIAEQLSEISKDFNLCSRHASA